jgi:protein tyrosine phosphatase (PTP) superfamily phosphohydrolase (DUF442 family)
MEKNSTQSLAKPPSHLTRIFWVFPLSPDPEAGGCIGLCRAPGRNYVDAKDKSVNLKEDLRHFSKQGIRTIVCLLNKYELRHIGIELAKYEQLCAQAGISLVHFPIVEMSVPEVPVYGIDSAILNHIHNKISAQENVLVHCRGGIGRAGTIAALFLLKTGTLPSPVEAFKYLRERRHPKCVESSRQEQYVTSYMNHLGGIKAREEGKGQ